MCQEEASSPSGPTSAAMVSPDSQAFRVSEGAGRCRDNASAERQEAWELLLALLCDLGKVTPAL